MDTFLKNKGFTLIEIIIAISIITVGIFSIIPMFFLGANMVKMSQMSASGIQICQEKIEEIVSYSYDDVVVGSVSENPLPSPFAGFHRETKITYVDPASGMAEVITDKGMKKIEVTAYWANLFGVGEKSVKITSLISKK